MNCLRVTASLSLLLLAFGCSRTALDADCPNGYRRDDVLARCVCSTDEGCPTAMRCEEGRCVCRATECCPSGYEYSTDGESCVCRDSSCCPADHLWRAEDRRCACGGRDCCPDGFAWDPATSSCECRSDACCPKGFGWDAGARLCGCASDRCCPVDSLFDPVSRDCVCAKSSCCPPSHVYDRSVGACVCVGDSCCPVGFKKASDGSNRCVCISDASCPVRQRCDATSGACRCAGANGCPPNHFCNELGFCQSTAACTSNLDCPAGQFCDGTSARCLADGPCTMDEHCALNSICAVAQLACHAGCRRDGDCAQKLSCVGGQCSFSCRDNQACPAGEFCELVTGRCRPRAGRVDCRSCGPNLGTCGDEALARCLGFITEGQQTTFCGMACQSEADCPSGYDCGGVIYGCQGSASCEQVAGESITCRAYQVENEPGDQFYCSDASGRPHTYFRACAPKSGVCPAVVAP
jgi:hypothetical protein